MKRLIAFLIFCLALANTGLTAVENYSARKEASQLVVSSSTPLLTLFDDKYVTMATNANWPSLFSNYRVTNYLRFGLNPDAPLMVNQRVNATFEINLWKWNGSTFVVSTETKTLTIDFSNTIQSNIVDEMATYAFSDAHKIEVKLTGLSAIAGGTFDVNGLFVSVETEVERYYAFGGSAPTGLGYTPSADGNYFEFRWNPIVGAEYYELEWVHINDATLTLNTYKTSADLTYNYYLNSTRVVVKGNHYSIPKIFDHGYVVYRVRAVGLIGSTFTLRKDGLWTNSSESGTVAGHVAANVIPITSDYDPGMNWAHQVGYSDNGERFESVGFSDGLGRGRQSVTHNTETNQAVISNVYYDELGRPVVSDLPTPQDGEVLKHNPNFNLSAVSGITYQASEMNAPGSNECEAIANGFSTTSGAGKYYSPSNPDQDGENKRIPNAEQFPFSRVQYRNDFTGRVDKVSAFGEDLKLGSGHETQFFYPSSNQYELDRLFGAEVGDASHYQKMVTVDANGQVYTQYFDMAGRVIASYLEGDSPQNLESIEGNGQQTVTTHLLPENEQGIETDAPSATLTYNEFISQEADYVFNYAFTPKQFYNLCTPTNICLDCVYDLDFKIVDKCNNVVFAHIESLIGADLDKLCVTKPAFTYATDAIHLTKGEYQIVKKLSVNQQAIENNWCYYADNATCISSLSSLFNEDYLAEPFVECNPTIDEVAGDDCSVQRALMLGDLSPGGQYAGFNNNNGVLTPLTAGANVHSVLTLNSLGTNKDWKHPYNPAYTSNPAGPYHYFENGQVVYVNGIEPQNLPSFEQFITNFQPSWAEALLTYHPEYCFLQTCESQAMEDSRTYDEGMMSVSDYTAACAAGYFKPLSSSQNPSPIPCSTFTTADPFFAAGGLGASYNTAMSNAMNNYLGSGYTIWQYAVYNAYCGGQGNISTCLIDFNRFLTENPSCNLWDLIWVNYRGMYLELKASYEYQVMHNQPNCDNSYIGSTTNWQNNHAIWGNANTLPDADGDGLPENGSGLTDAEFDAYLNAQIASNCQTVCEEYANDWLATLGGCEQIQDMILNDPTAYTNLKNDLIALCASGCNADHPMGSSTSPAGQTIDDVLLNRLGVGYEDALCSGLLISSPEPYQTTENLMNLLEAPLDVCACDAVLEAKWQLTNANPNNNTLEELLALNTGVALEDADYLICQCEKVVNGGSYNPENPQWVYGANAILANTNIEVPTTLACPGTEGCPDCTVIGNHKTTLMDRFTEVSDFSNHANYPTILTNYLNQKLHFHLSYYDYVDFLGKCQADLNNPYCTVNPYMKEWADVMTLIAYRGMTLRSQSTPVDLATNNIVFANSKWKEAIIGNQYWSSQTGNDLTVNFGQVGSSSCSIILTLPANPTFGFEDIVSFGTITPLTESCSSNNTFSVNVKYFSCGELKTATLTGSTTCMQVNECVCSPQGLTLCDELPSLEETCYQPRLDMLYQDALEAYTTQYEDLYDEYIASYNSVCATAFSTESLQFTGPRNTYQYTLFIYDQAGNLVQTVAPQGVDRTSYNTTDVAAARNSVVNSTTYTAPSAFTTPFPTNNFVTKYVYNSYDQLITTSNPDQQGDTRYWYDRYGRLVASQNPVQASDFKYSYVLYDPQGRPVEVGQADLDYAQGMQRLPFTEVTLKSNDKGAAFKSWVYSCARTEVTYTKYDLPMSPGVEAKFTGGAQQNLRLRVASVVYFDAVSASTMPVTGYVSATHYSYDIHGNVIEMLQDVPQLVPVQQDVKSTQYEFELLSGNVKKVNYQKNKLDQITHEYKYDKLNRLTEVFTSTDGGVHKSREAHYRYFDYGPLARVETGQHKVQGSDYSYTINGWLKGMNSVVLGSANDPARDAGRGYYAGNTRANESFARDMLGYTLGYFQDDYKSIGTTSFEANPYALNNGNPNVMAVAMKQLFNGNIAHTVTSIDGFEVQAGVYKYDQLQRIKSMRVFRNNAIATENSWSSAFETQEYASSYSYDRNGNLKTLNRNGTTATGLLMDQFTYIYTALTNKLNYVTDGSTLTANYTDDINSGQSNNNYQYDQLGQLITDNNGGNPTEGIQTYIWRKGDKKLALQKSATKQLEFVYNPMGQRVLKIVKELSGGSVVPQSTTPWIYTYYSYDANGQVMATYDVRMNTVNTATLDEQMIYGASRLGVVSAQKQVFPLQSESPIRQKKWGAKNYELTNHLGNVNVVITDRKFVIENGAQLYNFFTYDNSTEGWLGGSNVTGLTASNGQLNVTTSVGSNNFVYKTASVEAGKTYTLNITAQKGTAPNLEVYLFGITPSVYPLTSGANTSIEFTPTTTNANLGIIIRPTLTTGAYNYSVQEVSIESQAHYTAYATMKADYYPFGMQMPGRTLTTSNYRFGYNGMEKDPEMKGDGNSYTTEFRQYDPRLGRWMSLDPLMMMFPNLSPYCAFDNNPVLFTDPFGLEATNPDGGDDPLGKQVSKALKGVNIAVDKAINSMGKVIDLEEVVITAKRSSNKDGAISGAGGFAGQLRPLPLDQLTDPTKNAYFREAVRQGGAFLLGIGNSAASNAVLGIGRQDPNDYGDCADSFHAGQVAGDYMSMVAGAIEMGFGLAAQVPAKVLEVSGVGTPVGVVIDIGGLLLASHGATVIEAATSARMEDDYESTVNSNTNNMSSNGSSGYGSSAKYKQPKPGISGKQGAKDVPSWAKGEKPLINENGDKFARRLLDNKYGRGNYSTKSNTEYSKIKKWGDRAFQ
jgi:RHS repeat-associated protein